MKEIAENIGAPGLAPHYSYSVKIKTHKGYIELKVKDGPVYFYTSMAALLKEWEFEEK